MPGIIFQENTESMNSKDISSRGMAARRADFPSLERMHKGFPLAYLDGPAGTQMPQQVIDAISGYYVSCNANSHGQFITTIESDAMLEETRQTVATFLGAPGGKTISFGANMTTLNFSLSRAIGRSLQSGDEVVITELDHEANRGPWLALRNQGVIVREAAVRPDATLDYDDFEEKINGRTRLVAMGVASNAFGTVNDIGRIREITSRFGALLLVDAVHYAPHFPIDVVEMNVDLLLCSAYKFYGPHVGILYAREGLLDHLDTDRLRTQDQHAPYRIETGTLNHAAIAGVQSSVAYIALLGHGTDPRSRIIAGMQNLGHHERGLGMKLYQGLQKIPNVTVYGQSFDVPRRAPTVSFTVDGKQPAHVSKHLAEHGICTWNGHFYAIRPMEVMGLLDRGGVIRVGISLYTTDEEVTRLLNEVRFLAT
jgi:cysteine desulfurase family protein (TIGR01976 family)